MSHCRNCKLIQNRLDDEKRALAKAIETQNAKVRELVALKEAEFAHKLADKEREVAALLKTVAEQKAAIASLSEHQVVEVSEPPPATTAILGDDVAAEISILPED